MDRTNTLGLAAQVAFWMFLSLLPLAAVLGYLVARLSIAHTAVQSAVLESLPVAGRKLVLDELEHVANWNRGAAGPLAMVSFVWLASGGIHSIFDALELQAGTARPWWEKKLLALFTCVAISVGAAVIALLAAGAGIVFHFIGRAVPDALDVAFGPTWTIARVVASFCVAIALTFSVYAIGTPSRARGQTRFLPGAVFAVVFDAICAWGYGVYLALFGIGTGYEAGLAAIGVTLTSLYLISLGVLVGASLNDFLAAQAAAADVGRA
jgi:membrane protein